MKTEVDTSRPALYVGTYHKYNSGSIEGAWLYLENYADKEEFLKACAELHKDEIDPEFMFQDYQNFPKSFYSESSVSDELFEFIALDDDDQILLELYRDNINQEADISEARDSFHGSFDSLEDYVIDYWEQCGDFKQDSKNWWHPTNYIDWERMGHDLEQSGDITSIEHNGQVYIFNR